MTVVVDASVAAKWFLPEVGTDLAEDLLNTPEPLAAPDFLLVELANTLWVKSRVGQIAVDRALRAVAQTAASIALHPTPPLVGSALAMAGSVGQPVYDCLYLVLADREGAILITADRRFRDAVRSVRPKARVFILGEAFR